MAHRLVRNVEGSLQHGGPFAANSGRSRSPRRFPVSGRSRQHAEVAAVVDARRRYQRGEAVEQLQRRQKMRRTELGTLIKQAFGIEFA
jgi:hypothetical protein